MEMSIPSLVSQMTPAQVLSETYKALAMIKAALVRSVRPSQGVIATISDFDSQGNEYFQDITWDFTDPVNLAYVDNLHCRNARMYLREAKSKGDKWPDIEKVMGRQVVYALNHGGVRPHSFSEITAILYPPPACKIMPFNQQARDFGVIAAPVAAPVAPMGQIVAFTPRAKRAPAP